MKTKEYFKVVAMCGHVGKNHYVPIAFAVVAENRKDASAKVKKYPRVKKQRKDVIISCNEVSYQEYKEIKKVNDNDPYLKCSCNKDQLRIVGFSKRVMEIKRPMYENNYKEKRYARISYKFKKQKALIRDLFSSGMENSYEN